MRVQLLAAVRVLVVLTIITGVLYPLAVLGASQLAFRHAANGSQVEVGGKVVGSSLLAQPFTGAQWFHPRPSAVGYDTTASGASNLGPSSSTLIQGVAKAAAAYRRENGLPRGAAVPVDAVTSSGSGLDPHISVANARLQAPRVAGARGLALPQVLAAIDAHTDARPLGVLGEPGVNVLELNVALQQLPARQT